jgi:hypothetical protein
MERVVYFLGAGFSAPLGLPLISNFVETAKDQHLIERRGGPSFDEVFANVRRLSQIKNVYSAQLDNIEEILSILDVDAFLGRASLRDMFQDFIASVIQFRTPQMTRFPDGRIPENWQHTLFGPNERVRGYGYFVAAVQQFLLARQGDGVRCSRIVNAPIQYDIVTANYDCILENVCAYASSVFDITRHVAFRRHPTDDAQNPVLAKLHGSVDGGPIVPPTWSKGSHPQISPSWQLAREVLGRAQHLRFIGYSLPEADSYVRYLLKSAALESEHLKSITVLCLDPDGEVRKRFENFVTLRRFRFESQDALSLLNKLGNAADPPTAPWQMLEQAHRGIFGSV